MIAWIEQYWLGVVFGAIAALMAKMAHSYKSLYLAEKNHQKTKEQKAFYAGLEQTIKDASAISRTEETKLQEQIDVIRDGILSLQSRNFRQECKDFLAPTRIFTIEEFEYLQTEHDIYNALGGNHSGDTLFSLVEKKAAEILTDEK